MKRSKKSIKSSLFIILLIAVFVSLAVFAAKHSFSERKAGERFSEIDYYSMSRYSDASVRQVTDALKSGKSDKLKDKMKKTDGLDAVVEFADWSAADFKKATSLGTGSLSAAPDSNGLMDVNERIIVDIGGTKYVLFVETLTSRWGRNNEGISAIAVTTFEHFDELNYAWNGEADDESVLAGSLFWTGNQQSKETAKTGELVE